MVVYTLIVGLVFCVLGVFMKLGWLNFLILRYELFHKVARKKEFTVNKKGLANFYTILFFVIGVPLLILGIVELTISDLYPYEISLWIWVTCLVIAFIAILYVNLSQRFIIPIEKS
ncbi:MAG: DUF3784 domain-containing protein [Promethearchaeota archaeon]